MRLLNTRTLRLEYFHDQNAAPEYAILLHTWGDDEILFADLDPAKNPEEGKLATTKSSLEKVLGTAREALSNGYTYIWIDSCCIDKSSSAELSEAINSMFSWYAYARECYAYLSDITIGDEEALPFDHSRWFTRGWTLQELIAPSSIVFFDSRWKRIGTRAGLALELAAKTGIPVGILNRQAVPHQRHSEELRNNLDGFSVSARMIWAEGRNTTRVEDRAYSLMGIFDVNMPLLYGEGVKAFMRLQEIILTQANDQSILAFAPRWSQPTNLADDPAQFVRGLETYQHILTKPMTIVSGDIEVDVLLCHIDPRLIENSMYSSQDYSLAVLHCNVAGDILQRIAILLKAVNVGTKVFARVSDEDKNFGILPVCFKLELGDDGKTWAVPASHGKFSIFKGLRDDTRLSILEFERTRIVIKPPDDMFYNPGRQANESPLQISLHGQHSGEFWFADTYGNKYEKQSDYIRVDATGPEAMPFSGAAGGLGAWDMAGTGIISLTRAGLSERECAEEDGASAEEDVGFNIMWGCKRASSPPKAEMLCFVFPRATDVPNARLYNFPVTMMPEFQSKAASVSSCWNEGLGRRATAKIWTKTVLDRTCAFLTVDVSGASNEGKVSDGSKVGDEGEEGDKGKVSDGGRASD